MRLWTVPSVVALCVMATLAAPAAQARSYKVLYSFQGTPDGAHPYAGVIRDAHGNLYGTTGFGGGDNLGAVFQIDANGKETVLHSFGGSDGEIPYAGMIRDKSGNLYGTTELGGGLGLGTVFQMDSTGKETLLHSFGGSDGEYPYAGVIRDKAGNLYGTTSSGGNGLDLGAVFQMDSTGKETVLVRFVGGSDGAYPYGGVIQDAQGNLYGTTSAGGGSGCDGSGCGIVFQLAPGPNGQWTYTVLYRFGGSSDGASPNGSLLRDAEGNVYGTTWAGGTYGAGTVFKLSKTGKETVLYSFHGADGANPYGAVIRDARGNIYGTTWGGGTYGFGAVFEVKP